MVILIENVLYLHYLNHLNDHHHKKEMLLMLLLSPVDPLKITILISKLHLEFVIFENQWDQVVTFQISKYLLFFKMHHVGSSKLREQKKEKERTYRCTSGKSHTHTHTHTHTQNSVPYHIMLPRKEATH